MHRVTKNERSYLARMRRCVCVRTAGRGALVALLAFPGACGNLTSGGFGEVEVVVATDSVALSPLLEPPLASSLVPSRAGSGEQLDGTLTVRVQVFALTGAGEPVEITSGVQELVMPLSGSAPFVLARKELPSGGYAGIRTVFASVVAQVEGGLVIDGVPVRGPVTVDLGSEGRIVVDTPRDLRIEEDLDARIEVDLHTTRWIRLLDSQGRVQPEDFRREVRVRG